MITLTALSPVFSRACLVALVTGLGACSTTSVETASVSSSLTSKTTRQQNGLKRLVKAEAKKQGVPEDLALAVVHVESSFNPSAVGQAGEIGLMQIKPQTARGMGFSGSRKALFKPETNIKYGMKYLAGAYERGGGTICGTILKYNGGHYAKRMNPISARYCRKVKTILAKS